MGTGESLIAEAERWIGYHESPAGSNRTEFGQWYGMNGVPWCAEFVSYCAAHSGNDGAIPRHSYTPDGAAWFQRRGQWRSGAGGAQRGDIVYFAFPGMGRINHVGIVTGVRGGGLETIEGNTGDGNDRNGGVVARRFRTSYVAGTGRPLYAEEDDMGWMDDRAAVVGAIGRVEGAVNAILGAAARSDQNQGQGNCVAQYHYGGGQHFVVLCGDGRMVDWCARPQGWTLEWDTGAGSCDPDGGVVVNNIIDGALHVSARSADKKAAIRMVYAPWEGRWRAPERIGAKP